MKSSELHRLAEGASPTMRANIERVLGVTAKQLAGKFSATTDKPAIRMPGRRKPNKTEQRFIDYYGRIWSPALMIYEGLSLRLPAGTSYRADWFLWWPGERGCLVECKSAFIHKDASLEKWKAAKVAFPCFRFVFAQYKKGEWLLAGEIPFDTPTVSQWPGDFQ